MYLTFKNESNIEKMSVVPWLTSMVSSEISICATVHKISSIKNVLHFKNTEVTENSEIR